MIVTVCPHCELKISANESEVIHCFNCENQFVVINVYCAKNLSSADCKCYNFLADTYYYGKETLLCDTGKLPAYLKSNKPIICNYCNCTWGISQYLINGKGENYKRPFEGYIIVKLEKVERLRLYHGTSPDRLESIMRKGFLPPRNPSDKRRGFESEGTMRYVGREVAPASNHSEDNCVIELSYSGFLAITDFNCDSSGKNLMFQKLPIEVGGIQYKEDGISIAFRSEALLNITFIPKLESKKLVGKIIKKIKNFILTNNLFVNNL